MFSLFRFINTHVLTWFQILCWIMILILKFTSHYLYLFVWITSLNHVHVWLPEHAKLTLSYVLVGLLSDNLGPSCLDLRAWTVVTLLYWSEYAAKAWISCCLSGPSFLPAPLIGSRDSHLATREFFPVFLYCISCHFASWCSNILGIVYHALW